MIYESSLFSIARDISGEHCDGNADISAQTHFCFSSASWWNLSHDNIIWKGNFFKNWKKDTPIKLNLDKLAAYQVSVWHGSRGPYGSVTQFA